MLDRRVVEILTNLYREIGHRHWRLGPLRFPCYSVVPNIWGRLSYLCANDARATGYENGALYYAYPAQEVKMLSDYNIENKIPADPAINASKCNSLYQEGLTEIRVNALYGLNLIRAF